MFVNGQIFDNEMGIISNVNVEVVGENKSTIANNNGEFNIVAASLNSILRFSHAGYDYDEISVSEFNKLGYINLWPSTTELEEVGITNNSKNSSNLLAWIFGITASAALIALIAKSKQPVKVKA